MRMPPNVVDQASRARQGSRATIGMGAGFDGPVVWSTWSTRASTTSGQVAARMKAAFSMDTPAVLASMAASPHGAGPFPILASALPG